MMVTCVDGEGCRNLHGMVPRYGQMLRSNFWHLVTSSQTTLVTQHSSQGCYITCLYPPLHIKFMVTWVNKQVCCNFSGMAQGYGEMFRIAVMLHSNFLQPRKFVLNSTHKSEVSKSFNLISHRYTSKNFEKYL